MKLFIAVCLCAYLLAFPGQSVESARAAMALWASHVAPSMFPFMVLLPVLTGEEAAKAYRRLFGRLLRPMFQLPEQAAPSIAVGLAAGSPSGAISVAASYSKGEINQREALIAGVLASGAGPVFLVVTVGASMFSDVLAGVRILLSVWSSVFVVALILSRMPDRLLPLIASGETQPAEAARVSSVSGAVGGILNVCGYMVAFGVFTSMLPAYTRLVTEISSGCQWAAHIQNETLAAFCAGTGGACATAQNAAYLQKAGIKTSGFFVVKLIAGIVSMGAHSLIRLIRLPVYNWPNADAFQTGARIALILALFVTLLALFSSKNGCSSEHQIR